MKRIKENIHDALIWSQQYTKTDMLYLAKGGFWLTLGQAVASGAGFLLTIAFANLMTPETYGTYQYVLSIAGILTISTMSGINTAFIRSVASGYEGDFYKTLKEKMKWGLIGAIGAIVVAGYYYLNDNNMLAISFLIVAIFMPIMDSLNIWSSLLDGKKLFKKSSTYSSAITVVKIAVLIPILFLTKNILVIIFAYFITITLLRALTLYFVVKRNRPNSKKDSDVLSYGKHLTFMNALGSVSSQLDKILLFQYLGPAQLAIYSFSLSPINRITGVISPIRTLSFPKFSETTKEDIKKTLPRKLLLFFLAISVFTLFYILIAPYFYKIAFPTYTKSIFFSQILALSFLFIPQKLLGGALTAHIQKKALYIITTINPIVRIVLLFVLLPLIGIWGAVWAFLVPLAINGILATYYFYKM